MEAVLDDNGLKEFIYAEVLKPTDAAHFEAWQKKTAKCQRILLEGIYSNIFFDMDIFIKIFPNIFILFFHILA